MGEAQVWREAKQRLREKESLAIIRGGISVTFPALSQAQPTTLPVFGTCEKHGLLCPCSNFLLLLHSLTRRPLSVEGNTAIFSLNQYFLNAY